MTTDFKTQIHAYGTQLIESQPPITAVDVSDLLARIRELPPVPVPVGQKPRPWVAVGVGVAVLVLFGGLTLLLTRGAADAPPATRPSTVAPSTTPPAENTGSALGTPTYLDLPNESSIGWKWYETGISSPGSIWRLRNGTYVAYDQGFNSIWDQDDGSAQFSIDGSSARFADPTENFLISTDGRSWKEVPLDRFNGFAAYAQGEIPADAPYFYVFVRAIDADPDAAASWSTWATDDGETWFEVLIDGKSAATYFRDYAQIGDTTIAPVLGGIERPGGILVSSDGGRSFKTVNPATFRPYGLGQSVVPELYVYNGAFRLLARSENYPSAEPYTWSENPVLWESTNGENWTLLGPTSGLEPQPDGRGLLANSGTDIASLPDGSLVLNGTEPGRSSSFDDTPPAYILTSSDGGATWEPIANFPTSGHRLYGSKLLPAAWVVTAVDGWIVFNFDTTGGTLATDGDTWVRIDGPAGADQNAIGIRGAVVNGTEWILLPSP